MISFDKDPKQHIRDVIDEVLKEMNSRTFTIEEVVQEVHERLPNHVWTRELTEETLDIWLTK